MRASLWIVAAFLFLSCLLLGGIYWSVTSESGSRALLDALSRWSGGSVQVEGWQGRLYGHFEAKRLRLHLAVMDFDAERLVVGWHPALLRFRELNIDTLRIGRLEIRRPVSNEAARMPVSLRLPFRLHILGSFNIGLLAMGARCWQSCLASGFSRPERSCRWHG